MTAGVQSGTAITTMHTMGMVMLVAAQVDIPVGVQIMTQTSEQYQNSNMYCYNVTAHSKRALELMCYWVYFSAHNKYVIMSLHKTRGIKSTSCVSWLLCFGMCDLVHKYQHF